MSGYSRCCEQEFTNSTFNSICFLARGLDVTNHSSINNFFNNLNKAQILRLLCSRCILDLWARASVIPIEIKLNLFTFIQKKEFFKELLGNDSDIQPFFQFDGYKLIKNSDLLSCEKRHGDYFLLMAQIMLSNEHLFLSIYNNVLSTQHQTFVIHHLSGFLEQHLPNLADPFRIHLGRSVEEQKIELDAIIGKYFPVTLKSESRPA